MLFDKKLLFGGLAMIAVGVIGSLYMDSILPTGMSGMTDEAKFLLEQEQRQVFDISTLFGILWGVGFLLVLISFGTTRRKKDGGIKKLTKKPET
ncbi:MAG: hypothetical protein ACE1YX_03870 [Nitrosopumilaceae archaeon]|nr:MAG: hypothetical protein NPMRIOTA_280009 [Nitrosopumilales archaeon]GFN40144.1 MAG: conserved hypothetical protein [Marine Group I thaumarchaeote]